jgi:prolyl-tRNA editing enzyme YbaK/EbsC (Cys-tRNA(Pro) deacylase)
MAEQVREHPNVARVVLAARERGLEIEVVRFPEGTRTAADAARAIGCAVGQIVKSLVFVADGTPVVALLSGSDRVDVMRLASAIGAGTARRADGEEARAGTGFAIGGIPPLGHAQPVLVVMDEGLLAHAEVWAAAGLPDAVFRVAPEQLREAARATVAAIAER